MREVIGSESRPADLDELRKRAETSGQVGARSCRWDLSEDGAALPLGFLAVAPRCLW